MDSRTVNVYAAMGDKFERDPYGPDGSGRAQVVNGRGFRTWQRFHGEQDIVWIEVGNKMVGLTPWQAKVYDLSKSYVDAGAVTIRSMALVLGCSPSTVSRALVKLMSWGLIGYITSRGRYAGTIIFRMHAGDGFERFRQQARAKVRRWSQQSRDRISRLWLNVAPYGILEKKVSENLEPSTEVIGRNIEHWEPQELRDMGII